MLPYKPIKVDADSRLAEILQRRSCRVNSLPRQVIDDIGRGIEIVAREETGVVQAVGDLNRPFMIGVQWHPEYLPQRPEQRRIFERLVECARENAQKSSEIRGRSSPG